MGNRRTAIRTILETHQIGWIKLREQVVTDDATVLGVTTRNYANRNVGTGNAVLLPYGPNAIAIAFIGKPADQSAAFTWTLYGYRAGNGVAEKIAYGTGNIGDTAVTVHPITGVPATDLYYADELAITAQYWIKNVAFVDAGGSSGEVAKIIFDLCGLEYLLLELTNCDAGTASETDQLEAIYSGF